MTIYGWPCCEHGSPLSQPECISILADLQSLVGNDVACVVQRYIARCKALLAESSEASLEEIDGLVSMRVRLPAVCHL